MKPKLLCFDGCIDYARPWREIFDVIVPDKDLSMVANIKRADCILFTGGSDISPSMYGDYDIQGTYSYAERDRLEEVVYRIAIDEKKSSLGICRGAQLACVIAGGRLIQDVTGHNRGQHKMTTDDGQELITSSVHHQMMLPLNTEHRLIAWSNKISTRYHCGSDIHVKPEHKSIINLASAYEDGKEPEVIFFPEIRAFGIQGHPEMMSALADDEKKTLDWFKQQAKKYLLEA